MVSGPGSLGEVVVPLCHKRKEEIEIIFPLSGQRGAVQRVEKISKL